MAMPPPPSAAELRRVSSSGTSRIRCSPFCEFFRDFKDTVFAFLHLVLICFEEIRFQKMCAFVSSSWAPLRVYFEQYPCNPLVLRAGWVLAILFFLRCSDATLWCGVTMKVWRNHGRTCLTQEARKEPQLSLPKVSSHALGPMFEHLSCLDQGNVWRPMCHELY